MSGVEVALQRLANGRGLPLPAYTTAHAAGADLFAAVERPVVLRPGERARIGCGIAIALPEGYEAQVRPRSGLALQHGVTVLNAPGTIDADYRGEIGVVLVNLGQSPFTVERGMRVAQLVVAPVTTARWHEVQALPASGRGENGFGSTGTASEKT